MTVQLRRVVLRTGSIILVLLALLPFTAPFSTLDLAVLFGDAQAEAGVPAESKVTPLPSVPPGDAPPVQRDLDQARGSADAPSRLPAPGTFVVPLRL